MLVALDQELTRDTERHCMGGFVLAEYYGLVRATGDVDVLESAGTDKATIARLAGRGSPLHKRHRVYIDIVTVADVPDDYDSRLMTMDIEGLTRLRLMVFERHDLVLAKLCRNIDRDREDVALRLHLDDSRADNGPLRVLPGTHTFGLLTESDIARLTTEVPAVDCTVPAGGVVVMRPLIVHVSPRAERDLPRRVLHIEYTRSLDLGDGVRLRLS